jgi:hypothetical protein
MTGAIVGFEDKGGQVFNVKAYGAVGNGTTDDNAAIVATDAAAGAVGGTVYFPPGTYRTSHPLVPSSGVTWQGGPATITVLPSDYGNFGYSFIIIGTNSDVHIFDLTLDCQKRNGSNPANQCGCMAVGVRWIVQRCHFYDPNYFGLWIYNTSSVKIIDCQSSLGGNNDSIGGGGAQNVRIVRHRWNANCAGNRFDNVGGSNVVLDSCLDLSTAASGFYFEGMTDSGIINSVLTQAAGISLQSDSGYAPPTVTNPLRCFAINNKLIGSGNSGIEVEYGGSGTPNKGGYNVIADNTVSLANTFGILVNTPYPATPYTLGGDIIRGNTVQDPNQSNVTAVNTGVTTASVAGILVVGSGVLVNGNTVADDRASPQMGYAIQIGGGAGNGATNCQVINNNNHGSTNNLYLGSGDIGVQGTISDVTINNNHTGLGVADYPNSTTTRGNVGYNPLGLVSVGVPGSGTPVTRANYDRTFYVTAGAGGACTCVVSGATTAVIPALGFGAIFVPAGKTLAWTGTVPTWTVYGN